MTYSRILSVPEGRGDTKTRNSDPLKHKMATPAVEYTAAFRNDISVSDCRG